ncbi:MAG TPA: redoxin family protein [Lentimicrobium sp.]|nr:redoxin family protein [Lentimicrobium sp.]
MKKVFVLFLIFIFSGLLGSASYSQDKIMVSGRLTGKQIAGVQLFMVNPLEVTSQVRSFVTDENGYFSVELPSADLVIEKLYASPENYLMILASAGNEINLTLNSEKLNQMPEISGSADTRLLYEIAMHTARNEKLLDSLNSAFAEAQMKDETRYLLPEIEDAYARVVEQQVQQLKSDLWANASSPASLFFIDKLDVVADFDVYKKVSDELFKLYPDFKLISDLKKRMDIEKQLRPGMKAPDISLPGPDGKMISLASLQGHIVLIDFWSSWCGPCRKDNPEVVKLYQRFHDRGFEIFGVSLDRDSLSWTNAIAKDGLVWTHVSDLKYWQSAGAAAYGVKSIPHTVLLDREGRIIARKLRGKALESKLEEIFEAE